MTQPSLVVLSAAHAVVYHGRSPVATYEILDPISAEEVETIRTADYTNPEPEPA